MADDLRGIFRFKTVYELQVNSIWSPPKYGYFVGGTTLSRVDRIDYANDTATASLRGPLSGSKYRTSATGNSNYGYVGGGAPGPTALSTVDRIDYSNDTATASPRGSLSDAKQGTAATGNFNYGYFCGGTSGPTTISTVDRVDFSNDNTLVSIRSPLSVARFGLAATGNSSYGWFGGGDSPLPSFSTVDRINYYNDTITASPRGPLSAAKYYLAATGNLNYGWFGGGTTTLFGNCLSTVDRIDYSNDTATASPRGSLSVNKGLHGATGNTSFGYFGSGVSATSPVTSMSSIDRIDYSNDTVTASPKGLLGVVGYYLSATSPYANGLSQTANITSSGPSNLLTIQQVKNSLRSLKPNTPAQTKSYGYFGGGTPSSRVDRIDYTNDTATASPRGPLSAARYQLAAVSNSSYGYLGGGFNPPSPGQKSTVDRIDYTNDTATASPRGPLSAARYKLAAVSNSSYGYLGGGVIVPNPISTVDRVDFSNDNTITTSRGPLFSSRFGLTATGNSNYGYFGGGAPALSTMDRINYTNDNATLVTRGPLTAGRYYLSATGNSNYGWFGGGTINVLGNGISTVDRLDYSNDTATTSPKGSLSVARFTLASTGNSSYGYFGGGVPVAIPFSSISTIDRIDYSNDTATASPKGTLVSSNYYMASTSPYANALPQ